MKTMLIKSNVSIIETLLFVDLVCTSTGEGEGGASLHRAHPWLKLLHWGRGSCSTGDDINCIHGGRGPMYMVAWGRVHGGRRLCYAGVGGRVHVGKGACPRGSNE